MQWPSGNFSDGTRKYVCMIQGPSAALEARNEFQRNQKEMIVETKAGRRARKSIVVRLTVSVSVSVSVVRGRGEWARGRRML